MLFVPGLQYTECTSRRSAGPRQPKQIEAAAQTEMLRAISLEGCCRTNSNQSLLRQSHCPLSCAKTTPLGKCGGAVVLEVISAD